MNETDSVLEYLQNHEKWNTRSEDSNSQILEILKRIKSDAVVRNDQETAKSVWCFEQILKIQNDYLTAFSQLKSQKFYDGWCTLEKIEIGLSSLERHYRTENEDKFKLRFIKKHIEQFQSLFPYKVFTSPALLQLEKKCTICRQIISIRNRCGHKLGEIYNGEECIHEITKMRILEISIVPNPLQKYSVLFLKNPDSGEESDTYDYSPLKYLMKGLQDPYDAWDMKSTKQRHPHSLYEHVSKDENCPCDSGKKYKNCCLKTSGVLRPHVEFLFHVPPPEDLPRVSYPQVSPQR